jgi:hypothetical protein
VPVDPLEELIRIVNEAHHEGNLILSRELPNEVLMGKGGGA